MARILILEDEVDLASAWEAVLNDQGHQVWISRTYDEFEKTFRSERIELIIVDLSLDDTQGSPKFSGLVALSDNLLRTTLRGQKVPCIVVSGHFLGDDHEDPLRDRVMPFKPDRVLAKPFRLHELKNAVSDLLAA